MTNDNKQPDVRGVGVGKIREAFESYQLGRFQYADITRDTDGRYWHAPMELEWETWQSALSTSPSVGLNTKKGGE